MNIFMHTANSPSLKAQEVL